jgi:hypothetical protein
MTREGAAPLAPVAALDAGSDLHSGTGRALQSRLCAQSLQTYLRSRFGQSSRERRPTAPT